MARDQWQRPQRATQRAILVARLVLAIPGPGLLITFIFYIYHPGLRRGLAQPHPWPSLLSSNCGFYWGAFCGAVCLLASLMLQAYGKKPEYPDARVNGTEPIFSWDAILEMAVWALSTSTASAVTTFGDPSFTSTAMLGSTLGSTHATAGLPVLAWSRLASRPRCPFVCLQLSSSWLRLA